MIITADGEWQMQGISPSDPSCIRTSEELENKIIELGFLPLFAGEVPGFSVEEMTDPDAWWSGDPGTDPWAWRQIIARRGNVAYGKFFNKKAGFISRGFFPYFANYRRDGYDFDARWDDELASVREKKMMDLFAEGSEEDIPQETSSDGPAQDGNDGPELYSFEIRKNAGFGKGGEKNFEGVLTALQMETYLTCRDFRQRVNKNGESYGWAIAVYSTPEHLFGRVCVTSAYGEDPKKSLRRLTERVKQCFPESTEEQAMKLLAYTADQPRKKEKLPWPKNLIRAVEKKTDPDSWTQDQLNGLLVAVGQLKPKQQKAILCRYRYGMTNEETGALMNRAAGTVGSYHGKAMKKLRSPLVAAWYRDGYRANLKACAASRHWQISVGEPSDFITSDDLCLRIGIRVSVFEHLMGAGIVTLGDLMRAEKEDPEWYRKGPKVGAVTAGDVMRKLSDFNIR